MSLDCVKEYFHKQRWKINFGWQKDVIFVLTKLDAKSQQSTVLSDSVYIIYESVRLICESAVIDIQV